VSPRSEELLAGARDRLGAARAAVAAGFPSNAASAAYYSMLYAARAALSEEERNARTHAGTWSLFRETFVVPGPFDASLFAEAHATQKLREATDYEAVMVGRHEAERLVELAERFVTAVAVLLEA
jgi:uncharacterized protein (UPF0332 family)